MLTPPAFIDKEGMILSHELEEDEQPGLKRRAFQKKPNWRNYYV